VHIHFFENKIYDDTNTRAQLLRCIL